VDRSLAQAKRNMRGNEVSIEKATEADLPMLEPLIQELRHTMENPPDTDAGLAVDNCRILLGDPDHHVLVAKLAGSVVGFVNFATRRTIMHARASGLIDELIVAEKYRGQGIGKRLVGAVVARCRQLGCDEVEVSTEKTNTQAREFYKRCGFEEDSVLLEKHFED
jgi:ribosomal protein S18 acetylase RimI-like enzyme